MGDWWRVISSILKFGLEVLLIWSFSMVIAHGSRTIKQERALDMQISDN